MKISYGIQILVFPALQGISESEGKNVEMTISGGKSV